MEKEYDVVVVGAGSAGCALAYRLAAGSSLQVLLLEAGSAARNPMIHIPLGFAFLMKDHPNNWGYRSQPEPHASGRSVELPRGKVLGGTSAINGMVYVRGQAEDYDRWAALGNAGWSYDEVLPYFKRSEDCADGASDYHGRGGPLYVGRVSNDFPVSDAFIEAAQQAGHPYNADINADSQEGVAWFPTNIKNGRRWTSARAFLGAGRKLPNLTVVPDTPTERVLFNGRRAIGVSCLHRGKPTVVGARQEVVLAAGAINSPQLLELSGIGQAGRLQALAIDVVQDLPGVGENLHDHWNAYIKPRVAGGKSYFSESKPLAMLKNLMRYLLMRQGFLANPAALVAVFYKALAGAGTPDAQIHFAPAASERDARGNMVPVDAITVSSCGLRPSSRGSTHIVASDAQQSPAIQVNYLATEHDQAVAVAAFKKARAILQQPALQPYLGGEIAPGEAVQSDADILAYIRDTGEPVHHLAGSCKMGNDEAAVVDAQLRVRGVEGLRVADASIMPEIVSGNTHAASVMIGEKAADFILKESQGT